MSRQIVRTSKFLSYVLRHHPRSIGLRLDGGGWADVEELIACARRSGKRLDRALLEMVVDRNDKQRFKFNEDRSRIRASQGHSIPIDLGLVAREPPDRLYHGTAKRSLSAIMVSGLVPGGRQYVHLSPDPETALAVGRRHGAPVVLEVDARAMADAGHSFLLSDNGVWLVATVPPEFLTEA